jgi:hypothetical protein
VHQDSCTSCNECAQVAESDPSSNTSVPLLVAAAALATAVLQPLLEDLEPYCAPLKVKGTDSSTRHSIACQAHVAFVVTHVVTSTFLLAGVEAVERKPKVLVSSQTTLPELKSSYHRETNLRLAVGGPEVLLRIMRTLSHVARSVRGCRTLFLYMFRALKAYYRDHKLMKVCLLCHCSGLCTCPVWRVRWCTIALSQGLSWAAQH